MSRFSADPWSGQDEWLEDLRSLDIYTRRRIESHLLGEYQSSARGTGFEFFDHKKYQRGDDYRRIDWNATARLRHPFVKRFNDDKEINVWLLVDLSSSMYFQTAKATKSY